MEQPTIFAKFAPQVRPHLWLYVNGFVALYSLGMLFVNTFVPFEHKGYKFAAASYLYYSLITTLIWLSYVVLELGYDNWAVKTLESRIEVLLAVVFTASSVAEVLEWKLKDQNIGFMEIDILMNVVTYAYETKKSYLGLRQGYETVDDGVASSSLAV